MLKARSRPSTTRRSVRSEMKAYTAFGLVHASRSLCCKTASRRPESGGLNGNSVRASADAIVASSPPVAELPKPLYVQEFSVMNPLAELKHSRPAWKQVTTDDTKQGEYQNVNEQQQALLW